MASIDPLAGIPNEYKFSKSMNAAGSKSHRKQRTQSILSTVTTASQVARSHDRRKSLDLHHTNILPARPDLKRLGSVDLREVPWWTSKRFQLAILCFLGFITVYAQRVNLSIAIVSMVTTRSRHHPAMVNSSLSNLPVVAKGATENADYNETLPVLKAVDKKDVLLLVSLEKKYNAGEFDWDKRLQGLILGAFFWGYLVLQVPGGLISEKLGPKRVIACGMFPVAILSLLSPVCARANPYLFLVVRLFIGVGEGVMYPATQCVWARWAPPNERSRLIGFSYAGGQFGNAIIFPIGGYLSAYGFDGGWPSTFYVLGICGFIWCVAWMILAADSPEENRGISYIEKKYIQYSLGERVRGIGGRSTPWKAIFTSRAVWAIIIAHMCGNYGAYMLLTQIPTYMKEVLKFDIKANGVFSMLPYLVFWFCIMVGGLMADFIISRNILSVAGTRKLMTVIGTVGSGLSLIGTGYMQCHQQTEAVVLLTIAVGLCGFRFSGYFVNHGDIAPAFAGTLFGISNMAATVPGIIAPYVVGVMTPNGKQEEWQHAFYVAAAIYFLGATVFVVFGQGELLPWAEYDAILDQGELREQEAHTKLEAIAEKREETPESNLSDNYKNTVDPPVSKQRHVSLA